MKKFQMKFGQLNFQCRYVSTLSIKIDTSILVIFSQGWILFPPAGMGIVPYSHEPAPAPDPPVLVLRSLLGGGQLAHHWHNVRASPHRVLQFIEVFYF